MQQWITTLTLTAALAAGPAMAASPIAEIVCAPTRDLTQKLERQYASTRQAIGTNGPEQLVEVWADKQGDWTMVMTYAHGTSCIVAMGENWEGLVQNPA